MRAYRAPTTTTMTRRERRRQTVVSVRGYFIVSADGRNGHDDAERERGGGEMCAIMCVRVFVRYSFLVSIFLFCFVSNEFTANSPIVEPPFHRSAGVRA